MKKYYQFLCPKCEREISVPPAAIGQKTRCCACDAVIVVPTADQDRQFRDEVQGRKDAARLRKEAEAPDQRVPSSVRSEKPAASASAGRKRGRVALVISVTCVAVALGLGIAYFASRAHYRAEMRVLIRRQLSDRSGDPNDPKIDAEVSRQMADFDHLTPWALATRVKRMDGFLSKLAQTKNQEAASHQEGVAGQQKEAEKAAAHGVERKPLESRWAGFRGIRWRTTIEECPDMILESEFGEGKTYKKSGEDLTLGKARLTSITYYFYKGRFYEFQAEAQGYGQDNWTALRDAVYDSFGKPEGPATAPVCYWVSSDPQTDPLGVTAMLRIERRNWHATWSMCYEPIAKQKVDDGK